MVGAAVRLAPPPSPARGPRWWMFSEGWGLLVAKTGDFSWPPAGTSAGHNRGLFHGHGQSDSAASVVTRPQRVDSHSPSHIRGDLGHGGSLVSAFQGRPSKMQCGLRSRVVRGLLRQFANDLFGEFLKAHVLANRADTHFSDQSEQPGLDFWRRPQTSPLRWCWIPMVHVQPGLGKPQGGLQLGVVRRQTRQICHHPRRQRCGIVLGGGATPIPFSRDKRMRVWRWTAIPHSVQSGGACDPTAIWGTQPAAGRGPLWANTRVGR